LITSIGVLPGDHPLLALHNVVVAPHVAGSSEEALRRTATQLVEPDWPQLCGRCRQSRRDAENLARYVGQSVPVLEIKINPARRGVGADDPLRGREHQCDGVVGDRSAIGIGSIHHGKSKCGRVFDCNRVDPDAVRTDHAQRWRGIHRLRAQARATGDDRNRFAGLWRDRRHVGA
jgi:hypothetical protein